VGERFEPEIGGGGTAFPCVPLHFNHSITQSSKVHRTESVSVKDHEQTVGSEFQSVGPETAKHISLFWT